MNVNICKSALGFISALIIIGPLCPAETLANDGREFFKQRPANDPSGKIMTPHDVVANRALSPYTSLWYFEKMKDRTPVYPQAFTKGHSMYLVKTPGDTLCIAQGDDGIVYGEVVSRNEFGIENGIFMAPDRSKVAFYRKDESRVHLFPFLDISTRQGDLKTTRYPMAGTENSEKIDLAIYDIASGTTVYADVEGEFGADQYLTNICWSPDSRFIYIQVLDRAQQNLNLNEYCPQTGRKIRNILSEHSETWVEPQQPLKWIKGDASKAIYFTDNRSAYWNLYLIDLKTLKIERLTKVDKDVEYVDNDARNVYFTAPDVHPVNNYLWKVNIKSGKTEQMTMEEGWHSIAMSEDCKEYVDEYQALDKAPSATLKSTKDNKVIKVLQESKDPSLDFAYTEITMGTVTSANGRDLNYYRLIKPKDFDPTKKYPLILYVYGGPHSQMVRNTWLASYRRWEMYMAQRGFVVFVMDNRGTQRHGAEYEHSIYRQCGQNEMQDQMQAIAMLKEIPWIDADRIGVYGWSYGGFMSLSLATNYPDTFKVCAAGGPVIDWKWYEVMYGERYMSTPQKNPEGFAKTSLLNSAKNLKANTLVIQGAVDPTVLPINALSFIQECIDNDIQVQYFTYPYGEHNMIRHDREHLVEKVANHFINNL